MCMMSSVREAGVSVRKKPFGNIGNVWGWRADIKCPNRFRQKNREEYSKIILFMELLLNVNRRRFLYKMDSACSTVT